MERTTKFDRPLKGSTLAAKSGGENPSAAHTKLRQAPVRRTEEAPYRSLFDCAPDPVFLISIEDSHPGRIVDANDLAAQVHGYTRDELLALSVHDLDTEPFAAVANDRIRQILSGHHLVFEVDHKRKDGSVFPVEVTARITDIEGVTYIISFTRDITERRRADLALKESEARWRFALEGSGDGLWDWNVQTGDVIYSKRWKEMLGYSENELAATVDVWRERVHPDDLGRALQSLEVVFSGGQDPYSVEMRMRCKDGTWRWIRARGKVLAWTDEKKPLRMIGTHTAIDQERQQEETERLAKRRLDLALQASRLGLFERDLCTMRGVWNKRGFEIHGLSYRQESPSVAEIEALVCPEDRETYRQLMGRLGQGSPSESVQFRIRRPDGVVRHLHLQAITQPAPSGSGLYITGVFEDITERLALEEDRRTLLDRYNTIFISVSSGLALQQADGGIIECNPAAERILGLTRNQMLGRDSLDPRWQAVTRDLKPFPGEEHPAMVTLRTGRPMRDVEMGIRKPDASLSWLVVNSEPILDEHGKVTHAVVSFADITAQRLAEDEREKAANRLQAAVVASRIVWWEWSLDREDFHVNSCGVPCILGYAPEQMVGMGSKAWIEKTHPEDRLAVTNSLHRALSGGESQWQVEHRMLAADGSWRWVRHVGRVTAWSESGAPRLMVGTTQDINQSHLAEERIETAAQRLQIALSASKMGVWRYNLQTNESEMDQRSLEILGLPVDFSAVHPETLRNMVHPDDWPAIVEAASAIRAGQTRFEYTFRIIRGNGEVRHLRTAGTVQADARGLPEWITGINEDVTREQMRRLALRDLNERLNLALRGSRFGVWELDIKTGRLYWDDTMHAIYGMSREEMSGSIETFQNLVVPADRELVAGEFESMLAGKQVEYLEFRVRRHGDGAIRTIEANGYLLRDSNGAPLRLVGMNRDISEQKDAERRRHELEAQVIQSQKLETLGTLAGGIAHDFNNILTGLMGFIDLASITLPPDSDGLDYLRNARAGGLQARDLVKRLLLFARRSPDTERRPLQLEAIVAGATPLLTAALPSSIIIRTEIKGAVPPVMADAGQIEQVVMNLSVNAAHAIGGKQGQITLGVRAEHLGAENPCRCPAGDYVCLSVEDNGCGMDEVVQTKIFDPFFTTKDQGEGTGLGLSIVHGIVHEHGGAIRVQSTVGVGSRFEIYLPVSLALPEPAPARPAPATFVVGAGRRVLLADDEERVRQYVGAIFRRCGFLVEVCVDGSAAYEKFLKSPEVYAIAVLDLSMPGISGLELIDKIRTSNADLPVILMSGDHERYGRSSSDLLKRVVRLAKPFSIEELMASVRESLGSTSHRAAP